MLCKKPFHKRGAQFGCGQCLPCRINRRRLWSHRILLEALVSPSASFLTLTYKDIPDGASLVPRDLQLFFKRLRKSGPLRYFAVGEYGDFSGRPHYHAALFGVGVTEDVRVREAWGLGHIMLGDLTFASASYVAGYVTKKMTAWDDVRLNGRHPEFARMSLRPGIGASAMSDVAAALFNQHGWDEITRTGDVPSVLRHGSRMFPLGRYLRRELRKHMNFEDLKGGDSGVDVFAKSAKLQALYEAYKLSKKAKPFAVVQEEKEGQKQLNLVKRHAIYSQRSTL